MLLTLICLLFTSLKWSLSRGASNLFSGQFFCWTLMYDVKSSILNTGTCWPGVTGSAKSVIKTALSPVMTAGSSRSNLPYSPLRRNPFCHWSVNTFRLSLLLNGTMWKLQRPQKWLTIHFVRVFWRSESLERNGVNGRDYFHYRKQASHTYCRRCRRQWLLVNKVRSVWTSKSRCVVWARRIRRPPACRRQFRQRDVCSCGTETAEGQRFALATNETRHRKKTSASKNRCHCILLYNYSGWCCWGIEKGVWPCPSQTLL